MTQVTASTTAGPVDARADRRRYRGAPMSTVDVAELDGVSQLDHRPAGLGPRVPGLPGVRAAARGLALSADQPLDVAERRSALGIALAAEQSNIGAP